MSEIQIYTHQQEEVNITFKIRSSFQQFVKNVFLVTNINMVHIYIQSRTLFEVTPLNGTFRISIHFFVTLLLLALKFAIIENFITVIFLLLKVRLGYVNNSSKLLLPSF